MNLDVLGAASASHQQGQVPPPAPATVPIAAFSHWPRFTGFRSLCEEELGQVRDEEAVLAQFDLIGSSQTS